MRTLTATSEHYIVLPLKTRLVAGMLVAALGVMLIAGVGFVGMPAIHDAAHDVRHVLSFPCH